MGILDGKTVLVTGVTHNTSIAYKVAEVALNEGAKVVVSNFGRAMSLTGRVIKKLEPTPELIELDVTNQQDLAALSAKLAEAGVEKIDGVVHSIAFANRDTALGGKFLSTPYEDVSKAVEISAYSLVSLAMAAKPLFAEKVSVVGLTFDATVSWPSYDWMGVAKAALESASRYLARYLGPAGVRSNLVSAGPVDTIAKKAIPGAETLNEVWDTKAPLGWDSTDATPVAKTVVALLSDFFEATTGEMIHVDGGVHSMGW